MSDNFEIRALNTCSCWRSVLPLVFSRLSPESLVAIVVQVIFSLGCLRASSNKIPLTPSSSVLISIAADFEMKALARELYVRGDESLNLDGVLEFIHNADILTTSTFYKDLANISNQNDILRLPAGIRSARCCPEKNASLCFSEMAPKRLVLAYLTRMGHC